MTNWMERSGHLKGAKPRAAADPRFIIVQVKKIKPNLRILPRFAIVQVLRAELAHSRGAHLGRRATGDKA